MNVARVVKRLCSTDTVGQLMAVCSTVLLALVVLGETLPRSDLLVAVWMSSTSLVLGGLVAVIFGRLIRKARE